MNEAVHTPTTMPRRRALLAGAAVLAAPVAASAAGPTAPHPDAELLRLGAEHAAAWHAYNRNGGYLECEDDPLWHAYERTLHAMDEAHLATLDGVRVKARAAKLEARNPDGSENPDGTSAARWAFDVVNDLLRLTGGTS